VSKTEEISILFIADIVGKPGYDAIASFLPSLLTKYRVDICIANGENGANGNGLSIDVARKYFDLGIDVITGGNHSWMFADFRRYLDTSNKALRPFNYPPDAPGNGSTLFKTKRGHVIAVLNLQGRTFMYPIDCPFRTGLEEVERLKQNTKIIFVDMHAEATAEKIALGWYLDGHVSALVGTHTHVQTADERILPKGTAFISDAGMTGSFDSVIGLETDVAIKRFVTQIPERYKTATSNNRVNGVVIKADVNTGRAKSIERINLP
jgi:2',3'-cyclic-nucleotide 2'-phosphodiesterase